METIYIHYNGTGIKTLRIISNVILIVGLLAALILFIACFDKHEFIWQQLPSVLVILTSTLLCSGLCRAVATIAENSIHATEQRKALLKKEGIDLMIFK
jgi:uncharacterized membrane protein